MTFLKQVPIVVRLLISLTLPFLPWLLYWYAFEYYADLTFWPRAHFYLWRWNRSNRKKECMSLQKGEKVMVDAQDEVNVGDATFAAISDVHCRYEYVTIPKVAEYLLVGGDLMDNSLAECDGIQFLRFLKWAYSNENLKMVILIAGNHDRQWPKFSKAKINEMIEATRPKGSKTRIIYICNELYNLKVKDNYPPIEIYGSPISVRGYSDNNAFQFKVHSPEMKEVVNAIKDCDILMTHGPPAPGYSGCPDLEKQTKLFEKLKLHIFGHYHQSSGMITKVCNAGQGHVCVNVATCHDWYIPKNPPLLFSMSFDGNQWNLN